MLARVGSVSSEDIHVIVVGLFGQVVVERRIGEGSGEKRIVAVCMGWGGSRRKVFADKGRSWGGGGEGGFYRLWQN